MEVVGLRVVRGPDWKWADQDEGEGHVGSVVETGKPVSLSHKTVSVQWDSGTRNTYRVGHEGAYDLRILDNGTVGVRHPTVICKSCHKDGIYGMRWKCKLCEDFDLCTYCYMSDKHDISHPFFRAHINDLSCKVDVPKRQGSTKLQMKGIFPSAIVVRGPDWQWKTQDGGAGKTGRVALIRGWDNYSERNAASVVWSCAAHASEVYRLGYKGKVDLKYRIEAADGYYYRDHLPILGDEMRIVKEENCESATKQVETTTNQTENKKGLEILSQNLKDLYLNNQFCDFNVKVKDRKFKIHKAILSARSSVLASMLQYDKKTKNIGALEVSECDPDTCEDFLLYLYSGKIRRISKDNVAGLYKAAEKYDIQALQEECIRFMTDSCCSVDLISDALESELNILAG